MICMFCYKSLALIDTTASNKLFDIYACRGCRDPEHHTLHREVYWKGTDTKLYDQIQLDEYILTRYFHETTKGGRKNYCKLYKDCIGVVDNDPGATPLSLGGEGRQRFSPICELDHIVPLPTYDLKVFKKKLKLWTTFS